MGRLSRRKSDFGNWQGWLLGLPTVLVVVLLSYLILRPDPAATNFYRAQQLQNAGQATSALRLYSLLVASSPRSSFAPLALQQTGEILTAMARRSGQTSDYRHAIAAYSQLANNYSSHSLAGEALLAAGSIAANDLRDGELAASFYQKVLSGYKSNPDYVSEALLRLGRIALQNGDGPGAQAYFAQVLKEHSRFPERCAEAQYFAGVNQETLLKNKSAARSAYEATIARWPDSVWSVNSKERLGMLLYADGSTVRPARRVLLEIGPLPETGGNSRLAVLKLLLAARGLEVSEGVLRGWSLSPFRAGFAPDNAIQVLETREEFSTIAANAGLVFSRATHKDAARALEQLRDELDSGHAPFVSFDGWTMVVGYDSSRGEILVQKPGGPRQNLKNKEFSDQWQKNNFEFLSFHAPGETLRATPQPRPTPAAADAGLELSPPLYLHKLPRLSLQSAHRRTLRRASQLLKRPREGAVLLNLEALRALGGELEKLSAAPDSPVPSPEIDSDEPATAPEANVPAPTPAPPAPSGTALTERRDQRWKALRPWFGKPLKAWIETRRDAAAYLEVASADLKDSRLQRAAREFRTAMNHLDRAENAMPAAAGFSNNFELTRAALAVAAREINLALEAERRATSLIAAAAP